MKNANPIEQLKRFEIPGRLTVLDGNGELPKVEVTTRWSEAELYLQGAHVTDFQNKNDKPLLFLSQCSRFQPNQPIRGGIPIVFPWFGPREGEPMHGFGRLENWQLADTTASDEVITLRLRLPETPRSASFPPFEADYVVTVGEALTLELLVTNRSTDTDFVFESCLHTYFAVGDISQVEISGLKGTQYLDKVQNFAQKTETSDALRIDSEMDRVYLDTRSPIEIRDKSWQRVIRIDKAGSASTVVWNPWSLKAEQMPDFGSDEYKSMVCVESGNVAKNRLSLGVGESASLKVTLSTRPF